MARRFLSLSTSSADVASYQPVDLSDLPPGPANSVFVTDPDGTQAEWSDKLEIETLTVNGDMGLDGELVVSGGTGSAGQFLTKTATGPEWGNLPIPSVVNAGSISSGAVHDVLVTGLDGNTGWSNTIVPTHLNVTGTLRLDSDLGTAGQVVQQTATGEPEWVDLEVDVSQLNAGSTGQVLTTTASNQAEWQTLPAFAVSDIPPGSAPRQLLQTNVAGTATEWTSSVVVPGTLTVHDNTALHGTHVEINTNLRFNTVSGSEGQFVKKTGSTTQGWQNIVASDVQPGLAHAILQTNAAGTANEMAVEPNFPLISIEGARFAYRRITESALPVRFRTNVPTTGIIPGSAWDFHYCRVGAQVTVWCSGFAPTGVAAPNPFVLYSVAPTGWRWSGSATLYTGQYVPLRINGGPTVWGRTVTVSGNWGPHIASDEDGTYFPASVTNIEVLPFTLAYMTTDP